MARYEIIIKKVDTQYIKEHYAELLAMLYPERRERVKAFRREEPAYISMTAGLLLQELVQSRLGISPSELVLEKNECGKPSVKGHPDFYFNLSHAGDYVVLGHGDAPLGIDIERIREKNEKVAKRCFTEQEYAYVLDGDEDAQRSRFYRLWTMKEAYLKLTGQGISVPLNSFEIDPVRQIVIGTEYRFVTRQMDDYWITLCAQDADGDLNDRILWC
ncbi:MAG: 4'-phosphopantetheinyl transferase family protein [Wujia sp.]